MNECNSTLNDYVLHTCAHIWSHVTHTIHTLTAKKRGGGVFLSSYRLRSIFRLLQVQGEGCCPRRGVCLRATLWLWCFFQTRPWKCRQEWHTASQLLLDFRNQIHFFVPGSVSMASHKRLVHACAHTAAFMCVNTLLCVPYYFMGGNVTSNSLTCKSFTCNQSISCITFIQLTGTPFDAGHILLIALMLIVGNL